MRVNGKQPQTFGNLNRIIDYSTLTAILVSMPNQNNVLYENHINFKHIREFY